jgi:amino acid transporter
MKKIIASLSLFALPVLASAQGYMMNYYRGGYNGFQSNTSWFVFPLLLIPLIWICFCIFVFVFWLVMLIDAIKNSPEKIKLIWVIVIIFTWIIGALIYYFVEKRPREKEKKIHQHPEHKKEEDK